MPLNFGVIGCGAISRMHLEAISSIPDARLLAIACPEADRVRHIGEEFKCEMFKDPYDVINRKDINAVSIITPSGARRDLAVAAAKSGKHVLMEKPIEITIERIDDILKACDESGVKCSGIFQFRFKPAWKFVKRCVDEGLLGRLVLGDAYNKWFRSQEYFDSSPWRGTWALDGGGALMNQGIHVVDLLQWIMGDVSEISAVTGTLAHERIEVEDTAVAALKFKNGAMGVIEGTTSVYPGYPMKVEIHGTEGSAVVIGDYVADFQLKNPPAGIMDEARSYYAPVITQSTASDPKQSDSTWHRMQIEDFVKAVLNGREPSVSGREGRKSVEIVNAIYRSAKSGGPVKLPL